MRVLCERTTGLVYARYTSWLNVALSLPPRSVQQAVYKQLAA